MTTFRPFDDGRLALCDDCRCLLPPRETGEHERWHAQIDACVPAGQPDGGSAGRGVSGGLGERLRALATGPHPDVLLVRTAEGEWLGIVAEVDRLEEKRARQAQTIGELQDVRERLTGQLERVRALFALSPDTGCRTTWTDGVECIEVPLSDLRAALDGEDAP